MKHSYYQTPRTLNDATFISSADPIETYKAGSNALGVIALAVVFGAIGVLLSFAI